MAMLFVRCLPDRVANTAPSGGKPIPHDRFVPVPDTPWIRRLIEVHGDIEVQADPPLSVVAPSPDEPADKPAKRTGKS